MRQGIPEVLGLEMNVLVGTPERHAAYVTEELSDLSGAMA
jgi:hypothetical protein